jgi:glycosyltransferase involved in cell wall biosynthesis
VVYQNKVPACDVIELISKSKLYVHPSYIENSSNSICEAQLLGVPVIAANVGGISSIIENEVSGFLFPSNDIIGLAALIVELSHDNEKLNAISAIGMERARIRHNRESILNELKNIYKQVISDEVNTDL